MNKITNIENKIKEKAFINSPSRTIVVKFTDDFFYVQKSDNPIYQVDSIMHLQDIAEALEEQYLIVMVPSGGVPSGTL